MGRQEEKAQEKEKKKKKRRVGSRRKGTTPGMLEFEVSFVQSGYWRDLTGKYRRDEG
jgi:hypothetical protein